MVKLNRFFIPYVILLIFIGFKGELIISFMLVFLHEIAHYFTAVAFGYSGFDVRILPIGAVLKLKDLDEAEPIEDFIISIAGPLFNLFLAGLCYLVSQVNDSHMIDALIKSNLSLGIFNLIPAFPLDGGRILRDFLSTRYIYRRANEITVIVSIILGYFFLGIFIFLLFLKVFDYNTCIMAAFIIISSYKEKERIVYIIMADIARKKRKFLQKKYIENRSLSVHYKSQLLDILSIVDKNKYNVFVVLDDEMRVLDVVYEEELLAALKEYGNITMEELLEDH
ncbi:M50 family metallopeptidase [Clostridium sp. 19966]|uniref:M50 family metallopeptidase n=1 Tax=Clostridium sp. 19966 TaxID=2768166 RepID=UPI0028DE8B11|nr:M50 family metallopeptidase [Clostridium sp. 19966]MDT8715281.1 M50 family metallopeptidase [Clostridium sp. 19966]